MGPRTDSGGSDAPKQQGNNSFAQDITERRLAEEALRASEAAAEQRW